MTRKTTVREPRFDRPKLLGDASVTIYLDGLMILFHRGRLTQAAVHTNAPHHELQIAVVDDDGTLLWPKPPTVWNGSHDRVKAIEPFWLFASSVEHPTQQPDPKDFSASLHRVGDQAYDYVLDFESHLYSRELEGINLDNISRINMPHGIFYSAGNAEAELCSHEQHHRPHRARFERIIKASFLAAADINSRSAPGADKYLVMLRTNKQTGRLEEVFSLKLCENTHYEMYIFNVPPQSSYSAGPAGHFPMYYDLFRLRTGERKFFPAHRPHMVSEARFINPDSPPCDITRGSLTGPLP